MYTIGEVAKFLGVSRDTLKFYEKKGLVNPKQEPENGYRKYSSYDIYDIITINFYREIDIEIKKIQEIRESKKVDEIELLLEEKEQRLLEEIEYKKLLLKQVRLIKENCKKIKLNLDKYTIKEMKPLEIKGEIKDFNSYDEYEILKKNTNNLKKAITLASLRRVIKFDENGITENKYIVVDELEGLEGDVKSEIITYSKCIYTIIEDGRWLNGGKNIDDKVEESLRKVAFEKECEPLGVVYVNTLLTTYKEGLERVFLEIYVPIK